MRRRHPSSSVNSSRATRAAIGVAIVVHGGGAELLLDGLQLQAAVQAQAEEVGFLDGLACGDEGDFEFYIC